MNPVPNIQNLESIECINRTSPNGGFAAFRKAMSLALGHPANGGVWNGGHPFEVEHVVIPSGKINFPYHSHAAAWEFYFILNGRGTLRTEAGLSEIKSGDFFMCNPNEAHQLAAHAETDLEYLVIADNPMADLIHYPDSDKWNAKPGSHIFRENLEYYNGENG